MKRFLIVFCTAFLSLLYSFSGWAEQAYVVNDDVSDLGVSEGMSSPASVDSYGVVMVKSTDPTSGLSQSVIPVSNSVGLNGVGAGNVGWTLIAADAVEAASTTTTLNLTGHVARVGDAIFSQTGTAANQRAWSIVKTVAANSLTLTTPLPATPTVSDQVLIFRPVPIAASGAPSGQSGAALMVNLDIGYQNASANGILKPEDAAAASGDAGVAVLGVAAPVIPLTTAAIGDYVAMMMGQYGNPYTTPMYDPNLSSAFAVVTGEDTAFPASGPLMMSGAVNNRNFGTYNSTNGDATPISVGDRGVVLTMLMNDGSMTGASSAVNIEDGALSNGQALVVGGLLNNRAFTAQNSTDRDAVVAAGGDQGQMYTQHVGGSINGGTLYSKISTANNNSTNIKATAGTVYSISAGNINAAVRYLKLYDKATAPTCGTDTPVMRIPLPTGGANVTREFPVGAAFANGIGICIVTGATDADNTSTAANEQFVEITYR